MKPCHPSPILPGNSFDTWCQCGHASLIHDRMAVCVACTVLASMIEVKMETSVEPAIKIVEELDAATFHEDVFWLLRLWPDHSERWLADAIVRLAREHGAGFTIPPGRSYPEGLPRRRPRSSAIPG